MNLLASSDKPLFFQAGNGTDSAAPSPRFSDAIRTDVRSLSGMQKEALVSSARSGMTWRLASDEGAYLNGDDEAPCPLSFVTTGLVCSYLDEITTLARERAVDIGKLQLVQDNYYTMRGSALKGTMTGGAKDIELEVRLESTASRDELSRLIHDAIAASPVSGLTHATLPSLFSLHHNGRALTCGGVHAVAGPIVLSAPDSAFDAAEPLPGNGVELIRRAGMSPKTDELTSFAGSSLAEQQDRILHVRGICEQRADGICHVEQQLFNPHGSIFHYLCDAPPDQGGSGQAPDALSYVSAGIGFCFMTQLGRYAKIARKDLRDYRIVQDTHFGPGQAAPIETHVYMESGEDDAFAQTALAMSEQTCFLHALCRTPVKTRVRLTPWREAA